MTTNTTKNPAASNKQKTRPWAVRALTLLLFLEAISLFLLSIFNFLTADDFDPSTAENILQLLVNTFRESIATSLLSLVTLAAAIGFLALRRIGWTLAMLAQGLILLLTLLAYFREAPWYIYPAMLYAILVAAYLHDQDVKTAFLAETAVSENETLA